MTEPSRRRAGRPPKYDWGDKRAICHKLYVEEQKSPADIIKYFAEHFDVDPSEIPCRKGFSRQFRIWGFPKITSLKLSADQEGDTISRMKALWEQNVIQKDIKATLAEEGVDLKQYEFNKLWKKAGLRRRNDNGYKVPGSESKKRKRDGAEAELGQDDNSPDVDNSEIPEDEQADTSVPAQLSAEEAAMRAQRLVDLQIESDLKFQSRKRRRRIRGYGHLPADAPGTAPRYASETSLDECKAYLHLSNEMYNSVRRDFTTICEDMGIIKKTLCGEGEWEKAKHRLIRENLHLSAMLHPLQPDQDKKAVALDCLCTDVTKRMRVKDRTITIADANNILGFNPSESKAVRRAFYEILTVNKFESKLVNGDEHWAHMRQSWYDSSEHMKEIFEEKDPKKMKCLDILAGDAMKRFREDKNRRGERSITQQNARYGPGPGPAWAATAPRAKKAGPNDARTPMITDEPNVRAVLESGHYPEQESGNLLVNIITSTGNINFDIDPMLDESNPFQGRHYSAYFRLAPESRLSIAHPKMWLGKLTGLSMDALYKAATSKSGPVHMNKVHGLVKDAMGAEDKWLIERDEELAVYLEETGERATFVVELAAN